MRISALVLSVLVAAAGPAGADIVHLDDVIIDGSACVGFDCVNGESFGFETIRMKENNLRIGFVDTSSSASFASNDWQITINDSANGGLNKFSIDDITGAKTPFTIEAGAPSNSLYVDDGGKLGLGTATPVVDVHLVSGNSPTYRLEQDGSSGFTPQTWDLAGNEANFFIRDATNGSTLPFRIQPGAPSSSIHIIAGGNVGVGNSAPTASLHVKGASSAQPVQLKLQNNGLTRMEFLNNTSSESWKVGMSTAVGTAATDVFQVSRNGTNGQELVIFKGGAVWMGPGPNFVFKLTPTGDLEIGGTLTQLSDVDSKQAFQDVDGAEVLARLDDLPIRTWSYKTDTKGVRHLGPTAQDFRAAFGLGTDDRHVAPADMASVAIAGVKELGEQLAERDARILELEARLEALEQLFQQGSAD